MIGVVIDLETYSPLPLANYKKQKGVGLYKYAEHPDARILCSSSLMFNTKSEILRRETVIGTPSAAFFEGVNKRKMILVAHNANFERVFLKQWEALLFPDTPLNWYCTASHAGLLNIGRSLDIATKQLNLPIQKDTEAAKRLLTRLKDIPISKESFDTIVNDKVYMNELMTYCRQDTEATYALFKRLNYLYPFPVEEYKAYKLDQKINDKGFLIDTPTVQKVNCMASDYKTKLNKEIEIITKGEALRATQYKILGELLKKEGVFLPNFQKATIDEALKRDDLTKKAYQLLSLKGASGKGSVAKYEAFLRYANKDNRVRGVYMYHGAHTGRWSAKGVQPQNFPKIKIQEGSRFDLPKFFKSNESTEFNPDFLEEAGSILRYMVIPSPGSLLHIVDYATIEPRILFWLTGCKQGLEDLKSDIYLAMASEIVGEPVTDKKDPRRVLGKSAVLGLGYGLKAQGFINQYADLPELKGMTLNFAEHIVKVYASRYYEVAASWSTYLKGSVASLLGTYETVVGKTTLYEKDDFLCMRLPSGSIIRYYKTEYGMYPLKKDLEKAKNKKATPTRPRLQLSYQTGYGNRISTHGGKIIGHACQRLARDVFVQGMKKLDAAGFSIVLHTHDEIVCEEKGDRLQEMKEILSEMPDWLKFDDGSPLSIPNEAFVCKRYEK